MYSTKVYISYTWKYQSSLVHTFRPTEFNNCDWRLQKCKGSAIKMSLRDTQSIFVQFQTSILNYSRLQFNANGVLCTAQDEIVHAREYYWYVAMQIIHLWYSTVEITNNLINHRNWCFRSWAAAFTSGIQEMKLWRSSKVLLIGNWESSREVIGWW